MATTKTTGSEKSVVKPKTGKAPAAKAPSKKAAAKSDVKKPLPPEADGYVKVTQLIGTIGRRHDQEATLKGLGLNKRHRSNVLENTPSVRGMIYKVRHLVKSEKVG